MEELPAKTHSVPWLLGPLPLNTCLHPRSPIGHQLWTRSWAQRETRTKSSHLVSCRAVLVSSVEWLVPVTSTPWSEDKTERATAAESGCLSITPVSETEHVRSAVF